MADWGISSNGRAPALHAGGTGIDARILHTKSASYFTAHDPDWGVLRRTQIATVVSNRTAFAMRDDNFKQLFGKFQVKIYFRLPAGRFPGRACSLPLHNYKSDDKVTYNQWTFAVGNKSVIYNRPYACLHQSPTSHHQASLLKKLFPNV